MLKRHPGARNRESLSLDTTERLRGASRTSVNCLHFELPGVHLLDDEKMRAALSAFRFIPVWMKLMVVVGSHLSCELRRIGRGQRSVAFVALKS